MKKLYDYMFPVIGLDERINKWCESNGKNICYGKNMTHNKLDKIGFPKRKIFGIFIFMSLFNNK